MKSIIVAIVNVVSLLVNLMICKLFALTFCFHLLINFRSKKLTALRPYGRLRAVSGERQTRGRQQDKFGFLHGVSEFWGVLLHISQLNRNFANLCCNWKAVVGRLLWQIYFQFQLQTSIFQSPNFRCFRMESIELQNLTVGCQVPTSAGAITRGRVTSSRPMPATGGP